MQGQACALRYWLILHHVTLLSRRQWLFQDGVRVNRLGRVFIIFLITCYLPEVSLADSRWPVPFNSTTSSILWLF